MPWSKNSRSAQSRNRKWPEGFDIGWNRVNGYISHDMPSSRAPSGSHNSTNNSADRSRAPRGLISLMDLLPRIPTIGRVYPERFNDGPFLHLNAQCFRICIATNQYTSYHLVLTHSYREFRLADRLPKQGLELRFDLCTTPGLRLPQMPSLRQWKNWPDKPGRQVVKKTFTRAGRLFGIWHQFHTSSLGS